MASPLSRVVLWVLLAGGITGALYAVLLGAAHLHRETLRMEPFHGAIALLAVLSSAATSLRRKPYQPALGREGARCCLYLLQWLPLVPLSGSGHVRENGLLMIIFVTFAFGASIGLYRLGYRYSGLIGSAIWGALVMMG